MVDEQNRLMQSEAPDALQDLDGRELPGGYTVVVDEDVTGGAYIENEDDFREIMGRESGFSFPLAALGTVAAGPPGTAAAHTLGAIAGLARHREIHGGEDSDE